ncbi:hypothetical protein JCM11491_004044 [Sporobolomyces phaffii]
MAPVPFTTQELVASFFGWLSTAFGTWLMIPACVDLPPPKAMVWPHDTLGWVAFIFGVLGFFCWTGPRVYVLVKGVDQISTASVVVGFGAHMFNVANIIAINWVPPGAGPIAASMPFVLTSVCCIPLDILRLYRKGLHEMKNPRNLDEGTMRMVLGPALGWDLRTKEERQPETLTPKERAAAARAGVAERSERYRGKMDDMTRKQGKGTSRQKEHVRDKMGKLECHGGRHDQSDSKRLDDAWDTVCQRERWDPRSLGSSDVTSAGQLVQQQRTFGTVDYEAIQAYRAAEHVFGRDDPQVKRWKEEIDQWRLERTSILDDIVARPSDTHQTPLETMNDFSLTARLLEALPPMSLASWHLWEEQLPSALAGYTNNPIVPFVLSGELVYTGSENNDDGPPYTTDKLERIAHDDDKMSSYASWRDTSRGLKTLVAHFGGSDARLLVRDSDAESGDVVPIWNRLVAAYGGAQMGTRDVMATMGDLMNARWDGRTEPPAPFFSRIRRSQRRLNSYYCASASEIAGVRADDLNVVACRNAALSDFVPQNFAR